MTAPPTHEPTGGPTSEPGPRSASPAAPADLRLAEHMIGALLRPRRTFEALVAQPTARPGASAIALLGILWSLLLVLLFGGGHAPRFVLLPIAAESYYLVQALLTLPVLTALWWLHSEVSHRLCLRFGGDGEEAGVRAALGFAYAAPMILHLLAELVAYVGFGFAALSAVARVSLPMASLLVWGLSAFALRLAHRVPVSRAVAASLGGLLVQAVLGALILR